MSDQGQLEVLLIRKQGGLWTLPKGRVEGDESDEQALRRELAEETGLKGRVGELVSQAEYKITKHGRARRKVVIYYLMWAMSGELRPSARERIAELGWFPIHRALRRIGRPRVRSIVRAAMTLLGG